MKNTVGVARGRPFYLYPAIEFLLWKWGAFPQPLFNSTAGDETVLTNQISIAQLVGQSQFVCDFRILARMKAASAVMLSPNFFLEWCSSQLNSRAVKCQLCNCRESCAREKNWAIGRSGDRAIEERKK